MKLRNKKTGEVWNVWSFYDENQTINLKYFNNDEIVILEYNSLAGLNEEWEDYEPVEPVEPLVEGRSQRAVLRAAARLADTDVATVLRSNAAGGIVIFDFSDKCRVELKDSGINVRDRGFYSLSQLCGEEEECES